MANMNEQNGAIKGRNPLSAHCEPSFATPEIAEAAVWIEEDHWVASKSFPGIVGGIVTDEAAKGIVIDSDVNRINGVVVYSGWNDYIIDNAKIRLGGYGCSDFTSRGAGVLATNTGTVTLRNSEIITEGSGRCATICSVGGTLKVYNSRLEAHGGELPPGYTPVIGPGMMEPPYPLGLAGTARTHLSMDGSRSFFYNCDIQASAWGAFSTDASGGCLYLEVNDSRVVVDGNGYGTYADNGCHNVFNRTDFRSGNMLAIQDGNSSITLNGCTAECSRIGFLLHGGLPDPIDTGIIEISGSRIHAAQEVFLAKTTNVDIYIRSSDLSSDQGIILRSIITDDEIYYKMGTHSLDCYGVQATFEAMRIVGDIRHEDTEHRMRVSLVDATLTGAVTGNPTLNLYGESRWLAPADSAVTLEQSVPLDRLDAPAAVTITATAAPSVMASGVYTLASGGTLVVREG